VIELMYWQAAICRGMIPESWQADGLGLSRLLDGCVSERLVISRCC